MKLPYFTLFVYWNARICPPVGLFLNFLLIWLLLCKTPKEIVLYSRILFQTCILDILFLIQETIGWPVVIFYDGIFLVFYEGYLMAYYKRLFGTVGLYLLYKVHQSFFAMDIFSVVFQFVHRYFLLNRNIRIHLFRYLQMLLVPFLLILSIMSFYFIHNLPFLIQGVRPSDKEFIGKVIENLDESEEYAFTVADKTATYNKVWHFMVIFTFVLCSSAIIFLGWRIIHFVRQTSFSEYTRKLNKQLTITLIILASFPLLAIAILVLFIAITVSLFGHTMARNPTFLQLQMATSFLQHYIPLLNPIATILINSPYRLALIRMIWRRNSKTAPLSIGMTRTTISSNNKTSEKNPRKITSSEKNPRKITV